MTDNLREEFRFWDVWNEHMTYSKNAKNLAEFFGWHERSRENNVILMQSSTRMDCKQKEIYVGDIIEFVWDNKIFQGIIERTCGNFFVYAEEYNIFLPLFSTTLPEILGNIYEDKNLIKKIPGEKQ